MKRAEGAGHPSRPICNRPAPLWRSRPDRNMADDSDILRSTSSRLRVSRQVGPPAEGSSVFAVY